MARSNSILLATIGAAHGVKGEVRVKSFAAVPATLADYVLHSEYGRMFEIERLHPAKGVLIVKFRGIDDRNAAEALNGTALYVERDALAPPDDDEFYHADLIGLTATTPAGEALGTVVAVYDHGAGDFLEIAPSRGASLLIPFTKICVPEIDLGAAHLVVVLPQEGEPSEDGG
jgi:16S rRNA processing protein RimM